MKRVLKDFTKVYQMLEDEASQDIYLNKLNWLISSDYTYIKEILTEHAAELHDWTESFEAAMNDMKAALPPNRKIVLYGTGEFAPYVLRFWRNDKRLIGFCSQTKEKQEKGFWGYSVMSPETLLTRKDLSVIISVSADKPKNEIRQVLREGNYPEGQIYEIPGYQREDERGQYFEPDFLSYGKDEILIDAGCCNLETSLAFKKYCKDIKKIYAFEPDQACYGACLARKEETSFLEVEILPFATWSERTELRFAATNDGASCICEDGSVRIPAVPIDEVIDPADKITMIKMDVEGAELETLKGARKTIQRDKPKLAVCMYHKPEDMTEIPLYVKELVPEYKLYIRHYSNYQWETVLYAVMP